MSVLTSHHIVSIGVETLSVWDPSLLRWIDGGPTPRIDGSSAPAAPPDIATTDPWNRTALDRIGFSQFPCPAVTDHRVYFDVYYDPAGDDSVSRYQLDLTSHSPESLVHPPTAIAEAEPRLSLLFRRRASHRPGSPPTQTLRRDSCVIYGVGLRV
jgi:hypothetical protein